jgi:cardiolipin synthase
MRSLKLLLSVLAPWLSLVFLAAAARAASPAVLINAVYYDTYLPNEPDEAFQLINVSPGAVDLAGWTITDFEGTITLTGVLDPDQSIWIARQAYSFTLEFGFKPDYEYQSDSDPAVPNLPLDHSLALANDGDQLALFDAGRTLVDALVYEGGAVAGTNWSGPTVSPYSNGSFGIEGQILYRKLDQVTGRPVPDTDTAADWAQATDDAVNGKKVEYPGWDLARYFFTHQVTQTATITYAVAPDALYEVVDGYLGRAAQSIVYEGYTFDNLDLADALSAALVAHPGMTATLLLDGAPGGGIEDAEKRNCQVVEAAGGQCWFMVNDASASPPIHDRYAYQHAKFMVIDGRVLLTGSENLDYSSMPADDKSDGTSGNRGVWLITDSPDLISYTLDVFAHDFDPTHHRDLRRWSAADPTYGAPSAGYVPDYFSGGSFYTVTYTTPFTASGQFFFEVVQSPDNALRSVDGLLGMVARAGAGDSVLVEQLYEHKYWGPAGSGPSADPNPRLEAYLDAARRGARVRLLLDSFYDTPGDARGNAATCAYVNGIASAEGLDLACRRGNPTGTGIHNKMVLVSAGGRGWVHTGSINGSENSSKGNRELAVQVESAAAYAYLAGVFQHDWALVGEQTTTVYLPLVIKK